MAEEDVFRDRQQRYQRQFLMDDDDAESFAVGDIGELPLFAIVEDVALVGAAWIDPAENFHQRRFARTVLTADRVNFPGLNPEIDVSQGFHAGKALGYASHFQNGGHCAPVNPATAAVSFGLT